VFSQQAVGPFAGLRERSAQEASIQHANANASRPSQKKEEGTSKEDKTVHPRPKTSEGRGAGRLLQNLREISDPGRKENGGRKEEGRRGMKETSVAKERGLEALWRGVLEAAKRGIRSGVRREWRPMHRRHSKRRKQGQKRSISRAEERRSGADDQNSRGW